MIAFLRKVSIALAIILSFTGITTAAVTFYKMSGTQSFWIEWFAIWMRAAFVMVPIGLLILAGVNKVIDLAVPNTAEMPRKYIQSLIMPLVMGSLMAGVATLQLHGWSGGFWTFWSSAMIPALPIAFLVGIMMTFVIKPKLDAVMAE